MRDRRTYLSAWKRPSGRSQPISRIVTFDRPPPRRQRYQLRARLPHVCATLMILAAVVGCGLVDAPPPQNPDQPSISAKQVCDPDDGQKDIARALGVTPTRVEGPTWVDHLYTCRYVYPNGSFTLSVKELTDAAATTAYRDRLASQLGSPEHVDGIGQEAFTTTNGSMVVVKDRKVLLVDTSRLPAQFADPPASPADVSRIIATVIMGCWEGD